MIVLHIPGIPLPWKAPFVGSRGSYSPRYHEKKLFQSIILSQYKGELLDGALCVDLFFYLPIPKSVSKKKRILMLQGLIRPTITPDRTNCAKLYEDCLQDIVFKNDSAIVDGRIAKWYAEHPQTIIRIRRPDENGTFFNPDINPCIFFDQIPPKLHPR